MAHSSPSTSNNATGRARSSSAPQRPSAQPPVARPGAGIRQSSIGIRRMPSSQALRQVAADPNASIHALQPTSSRLAVLDETCALENTPSNASSASSTTQGDQKDQPGRLRRASQAITSRLGLRKENKDGTNVIPPTGTAIQQDQYWDYNSDMVDVLDTIGRLYGLL